MKRMIVISLLIGALLALGVSRPADARVGVSLSFFYSELSPYGRWIDCDYGFAWVPTGIPASWQPYCNGEWIYTDYGWTWVSYDPWGGDPFHYGAWAWDDPWGWIWVPGTVWAPAWVTWCDAGGFIGWAPLGPSFSLTASGYFGDPVVGPRWGYVFVPTDSFAGRSVAGVRLPVARNSTFLREGRAATRFAVSGGTVRETALPLGRVQAAMGGRVPRVRVSAARTDPQPVHSVGNRIALVTPARAERAALASRINGSRGGVVISNRSGRVVSNRAISHAQANPPRSFTQVAPRTSSPWTSRRTLSPVAAPRRVDAWPTPRTIPRERAAWLPEHGSNWVPAARSSLRVAPPVSRQAYERPHARDVRRLPTPRPR